MKYKLLFLFNLLTNLSFGQLAEEDVTYIPPSPEASAFQEYVNIPVSLHTGTPGITVPLFDLKGKNSSISFSLSYHASGIKVNDQSSAVGLGWVLNGGGVVTRVVRGLPDEHADGYMNRQFSSTLKPDPAFSDFNALSKVNKGEYDSEPDLFSFNFLGYTGKILLDEDGIAMQLPEMNLKIVPPNFSSADPKWEIIDMQGIKYVFGKTAASRETTQSKLSKESNDKLKTFISSWYLAEIIYPTMNETISFSYLSGNDVYSEYVLQSRGVVQPGGLPSAWCNMGQYVYPGFAPTDQITQVTIKNPKYLQIVSTTLGSVNLEYDADRQDVIGGRRLIFLRLRNSSGEDVKSYRLDNNHYFVSNDCCTNICKRLKLNSIKNITNSNFVAYKTFEYNTSENLPARNSVKTDHWGYYNNNTNSHGIPPVNDRFGNTYPGADKTPNLARSSANILTKIVHETGGSDSLFYELHDFCDVDANILNASTGGVRVSRIETVTDNLVQKREFSYKKTIDLAQSSGLRYRTPKYFYESSLSQVLQCTVDNVLRTEFPGNNLIYIYSASLIDLYDLGGLHIGYSEVQVKYNDGSREEYTFHSFHDRPDDPAQIFSHEEWRIADTGQDGPPFISLGDRSFERGLIKKHIIFGADGLMKKRTVNNFDFYEASPKIIPAGKSLWVAYSPQNGPAYVWGIVNYRHRGIRLSSTVDETFDQFDDSRSSAVTTTFGYNQKYSSLVSLKETTLSNGSISREFTKYPYDYFSGAPSSSADSRANGLYLLCNKDMVNVPIEVESSIKRPGETNYVTTASRLYTFKSNPLSNRPVLAERLSLALSFPVSDYVLTSVNNGVFICDSRFFTKAEYSSYNSNDALLQLDDKKGSTQFEWGFNSSLVTGIINDPGGFQHRTTYLHRPLVGLLEISDPNNKTTSYSYDSHNRLASINDDDGNILSTYEYHLKDELSTAMLSQTVCVNGITAIDICTNQSPGAGSCTSTYPASQNPVLICSATGGCGTPSYRWEYRTSTTGSWSLFAETASAPAPIGFINRTVGDYYIRCTITDECGNSVISQELTLVVFKTC